MAEQTAGTAVIRVRLQISPEDRAILGGGNVRIPGGGGGGVPGVPGSGGGRIPGGALPGRGGPGVTTRGGGMMGGGLLAGAIALAYASPLGAPVMDFGGGLLNYSKSAGRNISELTGAAGFNRQSKVSGAAVDATVGQLGVAGAAASPDQIRQLNALNQAMEQMKVDAEAKVRGTLSQEWANETVGKILNGLNAIQKAINGTGGSAGLGAGIGAGIG